ncbi:hypothetical protein [Streptomyces sp. NBC_01190]|uniref:hypothetical protein n=1 Tax=Streptomyces sp. NBC_01190 TaxID=2903767 RepID=UPI0038655700|nr:hypothetical protein OG519_08710 [Streptomyces sp. NBC_01190]
MPRLARFSLVLCLLATVAAVVSFVNGSLLGIVWVLLAGLTSNMWFYYHRKAKVEAAGTAARAADAGRAG